MANRYPPLLVVLHWILAVLIVGMLALGFLWLRPMPSTDPEKVRLLLVHAALGVLIVVLTLLRLVVRVRTSRSAGAVSLPAVSKWAKALHRSFYLLVMLMALTGYATLSSAGLLGTVLGRSHAPVPARFTIFPSFIAHTLLGELLVILVLLHLGAALYHRFVKRDGVLARMSLAVETERA